MTTPNQSQWIKTLSNAHKKFESINPEKALVELGFAKQMFESNPRLQQCEPQSILNAVVNVARTSITLNPVMRLAYLIPRKNKCVLEFSYMGLVAMLRDNNCIQSINAFIVYDDEEFHYDMAVNFIHHKPRWAETEEEHKKRKKVGCYSVAKLPNGEFAYEFMPMWEIDKVKRSSEGSNSQYSAWQTWEDEMIKKSVIKRHFKLLISGNPSEALQTALTIENENNKLVNPQQSNNLQNSNIMTAFEDVSDVNQQEISFEKSDGEMESRVEDNKAENELTEEQIEQELENVAKDLENETSEQQGFDFNVGEEYDEFPTPKE
jgi:recombination protein RecT